MLCIILLNFLYIDVYVTVCYRITTYIDNKISHKEGTINPVLIFPHKTYIDKYTCLKYNLINTHFIYM